MVITRLIDGKSAHNTIYFARRAGYIVGQVFGNFVEVCYWKCLWNAEVNYAKRVSAKEETEF